MENKKIANPKTPVPKGLGLNDQDYMTTLLSTLKAMVKDMTVALTEASNSELYKKFKDMFENLMKLQRASYELMFKLGWYTLEEAKENKVNTLDNELQTQLDNLNS